MSYLKEVATEKFSQWMDDDRFYSWIAEVVDICNRYGEYLGESPVDVFRAMEKQRTYWFPNYYQESTFPQIKDVRFFESIEELRSAIDMSKGFRCPNCMGVSSDPYVCDTKKILDEGKVCDWKSFGLFGTFGKGLRVSIKDKFMDDARVEEIFYPVCLEGK